jgi:hypothetical protein
MSEIDEAPPITYRGYVFVNTALSSIQKGVQGAHALVEMFKEYGEGSHRMWEWAHVHKTLIFLEGGFHQQLIDGYATFSDLCERLNYPCAVFSEDESTLNNAVTAYAGIIPSTVFDMTEEDMQEYKEQLRLARYIQDWDMVDHAFQFKIDLCRFLQGFKLAI